MSVLARTVMQQLFSGPDGIPWLIFEYMPYGDLLEVLKSNCGLSALHKSNLPTLSKASASILGWGLCAKSKGPN